MVRNLANLSSKSSDLRLTWPSLLARETFAAEKEWHFIYLHVMPRKIASPMLMLQKGVATCLSFHQQDRNLSKPSGPQETSSAAKAAIFFRAAGKPQVAAEKPQWGVLLTQKTVLCWESHGPWCSKMRKLNETSSSKWLQKAIVFNAASSLFSCCTPAVSIN